MHKPLILISFLISLSILTLFAQPGSQAQTVPPVTTVPSVYLPVIANFIPTATPTPTSTPIPPTATATPTHQGHLFNVVVVHDCLPQAVGNWFQGTTYIGGQPQNGYKVVFSYAPDATPVTDPVISGPHWGYPGWHTGYYSHIIHARGPQPGDWYVWIVDDNGQRISDIGQWTSTGPGDGCNEAIVDFDSR